MSKWDHMIYYLSSHHIHTKLGSQMKIGRDLKLIEGLIHYQFPLVLLYNSHVLMISSCILGIWLYQKSSFTWWFFLHSKMMIFLVARLLILWRTSTHKLIKWYRINSGLLQLGNTNVHVVWLYCSIENCNLNTCFSVLAGWYRHRWTSCSGDIQTGSNLLSSPLLEEFADDHFLRLRKSSSLEHL